METASPLVRITFFACIAAVAAAFLRAPAKPAAPEPTKTPPQTAAPAAAPTGTGMQLLCAYAGSAPSDSAAPDARSLLAEIARSTTLDFLIATVPDPVDSHLDWAFDQQLDSLRRAHETAGYVVDGYWLPWSSDPALSDAEREANRAQRPGAILFRRNVDERVELRLLYLVGEIPTNGVNRRAFRAALAERDGLRGSFRSALGAGECADTLRVVGPVFSGASTSMRDVLRAWIDQQRDTRCVDIVSGAATNAENERRLAGEQGAPALAVEPLPAGERERPSLAAGGIRFTATIHTDETLLRVLRESILRPLGFNPSEVAILQESSTQYGASVAAPAQHAPESNAQEKGAPQPDMRATSREHPRDEPPSIHAQEERSPTDGFLVVPFPMNISSLRAAYAREEVPEAMRGSTPRVQLDLEERERLRHGEIPRALSQLSTPATDIVMSEIASALDRRHVRAVVLFATDVRDKLFLGREIAKRLPDVQLITTESNLLYLSHALDRALCGMLVLSTYPLLVYPSDWEPQSAGTPDQQIVFASEGAEGVYNAALLQLGSGRAMTNYAMPVGAHAAEFRLSRPPVWLTCVGRTTMQPLSVFPGAPRSAYYPVGVRVDGARTSEKSGGSAPRSEPMSLLSIGLTFVFGLAVLIAAGRVLYGLRGNALSRRLLRGIDRKKGASTGYSAADVRNVLYALHDEGYSAMGMLVLLGLFLPHATLVRGFLRSAESLGVDAPRDLSILSHACTWIVALAVLALAIDVWQAAVILGDHGARVVRYFRKTFAGASLLMFLFVLDAGVRIAIVIAAAAFAWCSVCFAAEVDAVAEDPTRFELFAHRAMAIDEGVSPLLPLFLVGLGLGAWCVWHLLRIRHLARTLPFEPAADPYREQRGPGAGAHAVRASVSHVFPNALGVPVGIALLLFCAWLVVQFEPTLESVVFGAGGVSFAGWWRGLFDGLLAVGIVLLLFTTSWAAYRLVVAWRALERCLAANDDLRALDACARVREKFGLVSNVDLWSPFTHDEAELHAQRAWRLLAARPAPADDARANVVPIRTLLGHSATPDVEQRVQLVTRLRAVLPALEQRHDLARDAEAAKPLGAWLDAAHDALAVEFVDWIEWALRHIRLLALFLLVSLTLTTALLYAYPFHPQSLFRLTFLFLFAGVVGSLLYVIAQMNRDPVLSRITGTDPGKLSWDRTLVTNLLVFGAVPLLALASSEVPALRESLFSWTGPLLKALTQAQ